MFSFHFFAPMEAKKTAANVRAQHPKRAALLFIAPLALAATASMLFAQSQDDDRTTVSDLDARYQQAVKQNDFSTMDKILADDFILVTSSGKRFTKAELLEEAKSGRIVYEHQEDTDKSVQAWGDTAVVTARLWEKGTDNGKPFDYKLWFSDVYLRTPAGWRYAFAQSAYRGCEKPN